MLLCGEEKDRCHNRPCLVTQIFLLVLLLPALANGAVEKVDCRALGFTETLVCSKCTRWVQCIFRIPL